MVKIIDNALNGVRFKDLGVGATFKFGDEYFMVIGYGTGMLDPNEDNAVNLSTGGLDSFGDDTIVIPFNCELIVL